MNSRQRLSAVLPILFAMALLAFAGCGGGDEDSGGSGAEPSTVAPADSTIYLEATIKPSGQLKTDVEQLVDSATNGQVDPGRQIIAEINDGLAQDKSTEDLTFEDDIDPWLGEKVGIGLSEFDGEDFQKYTAALQVTDSGAAQDFFDRLKEAEGEFDQEGTYEGYDYASDSDDAVLGVGADFFILGNDLAAFKAGVDAAAGGDSLDTASTFTDTVSRAPEGSMADVYVDIGGLIKQVGPEVDRQVLQFYRALGIDFSDATALASLVPTSDSVEFSVSTDAGAQLAGSAGTSELLSTFPEDAFAAFASAGVGEQIQATLEGINRVGFPPEVPKGALFQTLSNAGVNVKDITSKIGDVGLFVSGSGITDIGGALVVTTDSPKTASDSVRSFTRLLQQSGASGFSPLRGAVGFQVRDEELPRPLVVTAKGDTILAGLGLPQTLQAVSSGGPTLADNPKFNEAQDSLGGGAISGFIDAEPLISFARLTGDSDVETALPYLQNLGYLAFGNEVDGDFATTKVILALEK